MKQGYVWLCLVVLQLYYSFIVCIDIVASDYECHMGDFCGVARCFGIHIVCTISS